MNKKQDVFGDGGEEPKLDKVEKKVEKKEDMTELLTELGALRQYKEDSERRHKEKDDNIVAMRESLDRFEKEVTELKNKKNDNEGEELFKDIKTSKDLTEEEREEMTDTEIKQMDMIASLQKTMNAMSKKIGEAPKQETKPTGIDINGTVQKFAKEIAKDNVEMANKIIEASKAFSFEGLDEAGIKTRVEQATKLVPEYKAPNDATVLGGDGKAVAGGGEGADPFGVDAIVSEVAQAGENKGFAL